MREVGFFLAALGMASVAGAPGPVRSATALVCSISVDISDNAGRPSAPIDQFAGVRATVHDADLIVRVRAEGTDSAPSTATAAVRFAHAVVHFAVLERVAGDSGTIGPTLVVRGRLGGVDDFNRDSAPYRMARAQAQLGSCFASQYRRGAEYLLLLQRDVDGAWTPYWAPLQPVNEQLHGADDPWVAWVRAERSAGTPGRSRAVRVAPI